MAVRITPSLVNTSMADALNHALAQTRISEQEQTITDVQPKVTVAAPAVSQEAAKAPVASTKDEPVVFSTWAYTTKEVETPVVAEKPKHDYQAERAALLAEVGPFATWAYTPKAAVPAPVVAAPKRDYRAEREAMLAEVGPFSDWAHTPDTELEAAVA